jgi:hypothetical protein
LVFESRTREYAIETVRSLPGRRPPGNDARKKESVEVIPRWAPLLLLEFVGHAPAELLALSRQHSLTPDEAIREWQARRLSNFEYLLFLSTVTGHSFCDPNFYPIMPWVTEDFTSEAVAIGARGFCRNLESFRSPYNDCSYYFSRLPLFRDLPPAQNHADTAHTHFTSVAEAFTRTRLELTAEFFSAPEFLIDAALPRWASSQLDFVYKNRLILESEAVSANLHLWIRRTLPDQKDHPPRGQCPPARPPESPVKVCLARAPSAVSLAQDQLWYLDQWDNVGFDDLSERRQGSPKELRSTWASPGIALFCGNGALLCFVIASIRTRIMVVNDGHSPQTIESPLPVAALDCGGKTVVWVDTESKLFIQRLTKKTPPLSKRLGCPRVSAIACAPTFHVTVCGSCDGVLDLYTLKSGRKVRRIDTGIGKPSRILVTRTWGFVVVCLKRVERCGRLWWLGVWTINGELVGKTGIAGAITQWTTWTSRAGIDFLAFSDADGRIFVFEAYAVSPGKAVREFAQRVISLHFWERNQILVVVLDTGRLEYIPCEPG